VLLHERQQALREMLSQQLCIDAKALLLVFAPLLKLLCDLQGIQAHTHVVDLSQLNNVSATVHMEMEPAQTW